MLRLTLFLTLLFTAAPVMAATEPATPEEAAQAEDVLRSENPYFEKLKDKSAELVKVLGEPELRHLYRIREGFGVTRAVKMVRSDVGDAVKACGKENPDMKPDMEGRFEAWTNAVDPVLKDKEDAINAAIQGQSYIKPKEIKDYLKLIEQSAEHANKNIDKQIVTTHEACESLLKSMDKTQDVVSDLIADIELLPWPPAQTEEKPTDTPVPN